MSFQSLLVLSSVGLATFYFVRGAVLDFSRSPRGGACGKCGSGCLVARKS